MIKQAKIIQPVIIIGVTLVIIGFTLTQSVFRDTEESKTSRFVVGTLDLSVMSPNNSAAESLVVENIGTPESIAGGKTWVVKNVGSLPGTLTMSLIQIINNENGCNEPEALLDATCGNPGENQGELGEAIQTQVVIEGIHDSQPVVVSDLATASQDTYAQQWASNAGTVVVKPGDSLNVSLLWALAEREQTNRIQSDSIDFDVAFDLRQITR